MAKNKGKARKKPRRQRSLPNAKAFLICEKIIYDQIGSGPTLIALFSQLTVAQFPGYIPPFWLYLQLTDGLIGEYVIEVEIQDLDNGEVVFRGALGKAKFSYRAERFDVIMHVPPVLLTKKTGRCAVVAFADGKVLADNTFTIQSLGNNQ